ncbi:MAG: hypothetical protein QNJ19_05795 [Woeseiaceae bacterium]|nr:hypothetical protein [Woeseiaceae bacterium]
MKQEICRKLVGAFAAFAMFSSPAAVFAAYAGKGTFEETIDVSGAAVIDVTNESGAIEVVGDDVDQVSIRAKVKISKRLSSSNPARAEQIIRSIKRSPPVSVEGGRIQISKINERYQRHASISYKIVVPRNSEVNVQSVSGDVKVSGVKGDVNATSEKGKVTLAETSVTGTAEQAMAAAD